MNLQQFVIWFYMNMCGSGMVVVLESKIGSHLLIHVYRR
jgi:hypothetical protein